MLKSVLAGAALVVGALASPHANAAPLYDSLNFVLGLSDPADTITGVGPLYASFSIKGSSSVVSSVKVMVDGPGANTGSFYIALYTTDIIGSDIVPHSSAFYKKTFSDADLPDTINVLQLSFDPQSLVPGRYWVSLGTDTSTTLSWYFLDSLIGTVGVASEYSRNALNGGPNQNFPAYMMQISGSEVPLPAALPLFATILAGGGLIAWRRKRKAAAARTA